MSAVRGYYTPKEEEVKEWYELYRLESAWMFWNLITYLKTVDYTRNTVIFTSDHGKNLVNMGNMVIRETGLTLRMLRFLS